MLSASKRKRKMNVYKIHYLIDTEKIVFIFFFFYGKYVFFINILFHLLLSVSNPKFDKTWNMNICIVIMHGSFLVGLPVFFFFLPLAIWSKFHMWQATPAPAVVKNNVGEKKGKNATKKGTPDCNRKKKYMR